jgi:hypothetical protein
MCEEGEGEVARGRGGGRLAASMPLRSFQVLCVVEASRLRFPALARTLFNALLACLSCESHTVLLDGLRLRTVRLEVEIAAVTASRRRFGF